MTRRLVLMRHGRTSWNVEGRLQGHTDIPLDEVGHDQASAAAPWVAATFRPAVLWSSDLSRAHQTASYVAKEVELDVQVDARLREFSLGERTGLPAADFVTQHPEEHAALQRGDFSTIPGAEQPSAVAARMLPALDDVRRSLEPGGTAVVVSHGSAIKIGVLGLLGLPLEMGVLRGLDNCHVAVLHETAGQSGWRLSAYGLSDQDPDFTTGKASG